MIRKMLYRICETYFLFDHVKKVGVIGIYNHLTNQR